MSGKWVFLNLKKKKKKIFGNCPLVKCPTKQPHPGYWKEKRSIEECELDFQPVSEDWKSFLQGLLPAQ